MRAAEPAVAVSQYMRHIGEDQVAVDSVFGQVCGRVGPFLELLDDPRELANR